MCPVAKSDMRWWESRRNLGFLGTVVAGVVIAGILWMFGLIPVGRWAAATWAGLVYPIRVPLTILVAMVGTLMLVAVRALLRSTEPPPPAWLNYREDTFLGIIWRWSYDGAQLARWSIRPFCPRCSTGLRGEQQGYREMTTSFICDECRFSQDLPGNGEQVIDRVCRLIEREANQKLAAPTR